MTKLLVLGAAGQIARNVIAALDGDNAIEMTLLMRNAAHTANPPVNARIVQADVLDATALDGAMAGQDIVYANLIGENLDLQASAVLAAMARAGIRRLVFVLSLGIHHEVPGAFGKWNEAIIGKDLEPYRRAAAAIEESGQDYTIVRPAWLTDIDEVDYETTVRDQPFRGTEVSRKSVAAYITALIRDPSRDIGASIGIGKPGTDGDKPAFM